MTTNTDGAMPGDWVDDATIDDFCAPLTQNAAKVRFLRDEGLVVTRKRNGRPAVALEVWQAMKRGVELADAGAAEPAPAQVGPNRAGLVLQFKQRG